MESIWPYALILLGMFIEGELVLLSGVIASASGGISLYGVCAAAFLGIILVDLFYFHIGRHRGRTWILKSERRRSRLEKLELQLDRAPFLFFLVFRFSYGLRAILATLMGVTSLPRLTFIAYSVTTSLIWVAIYSALGLFFGKIIESHMHEIANAQKYVIGILLILAVTVYFVKTRSKI